MGVWSPPFSDLLRSSALLAIATHIDPQEVIVGQRRALSREAGQRALPGLGLGASCLQACGLWSRIARRVGVYADLLQLRKLAGLCKALCQRLTLRMAGANSQK